MPTLSDLPQSVLNVACTKCDRRGRYRVQRLIEAHGDILLTRLVEVLKADCPKKDSPISSERCDVHFPKIRG